jgi:hypothetical protein
MFWFQEDDRMDTSADSTALSDDSNPTQADISGVDSPTPTSDAASAAVDRYIKEPDAGRVEYSHWHR